MEQPAGRYEPISRAISRHHHRFVFLFILSAKLLYWTWGLAVSHWVPLTPSRYFREGHHYQVEPRIAEHRIDFLSLWIYCDAEWYLSIAGRGYPNADAIKQATVAERNRTGYPYDFAPGDPLARRAKYTEWDIDAKYAFFPIYPLAIALFHLVLPFHVAAFVVTNAASALAFFAFYILSLAYFSDKVLAFRSLVLLVFFPFSAFYQAYYAEGLLLLLMVLSLYFMKTGRLGLAILCGALGSSTKAVGVLIAAPLVILAIKQTPPERGRTARRAEKLKRQPRTSWTRRMDWKRCCLVALTPLGIVPYALLNYVNTGHWDEFSLIQSKWGYNTGNFMANFLTNIFLTGSNFLHLRWLTDHSSKIDYAVMVAFLAIIVLGYRRLPLELWSFVLLMWLVPLVTKDLMSFSRHMSGAFPAFMYLAGIRKKPVFWVLAGGFLIGSLAIDGMMTTWHWVG